MNKVTIRILFILLLIPACSLSNKNGIWKDDKIENKKIIEANNTETKELFRSEIATRKELNTSLQINIKDIFNKKKINLNNNIGRYDFDQIIESKSKFKFSKINNFNQKDPKIIFYEEDLIFFNNKGSIIRFNYTGDEVWKFNQYTKEEKKTNPSLFMASKNDTLVIADNISRVYAVNIKDGNLLWLNNNSSPFNSEIKIYKDRFFVIDYENILHCYSLKDGRKLWSYKTENVLIKSQKKLSIIIVDNIVYFNNSIGDITALDFKKGNLIWQLPTQNNNIYAQSFSLKISDIVNYKKFIYFSNNKNEFFSINSRNGLLNWKQKINSFIRPVVLEDVIVTVSLEGFLIFINRMSGDIIRITDVFKIFKEKKRNDIFPVGFVIGAKNIYLTTTNGRLLIIDIKTGTNKDIFKIDGEMISKPFINKNKLFIIKDKAIIRFN